MNVVNPISDYVSDSILTTRGDLLKRGAAVLARFGIGTANQLLKVNAGGTDLEYGEGDTIIEGGGLTLKCKVLYIGDWNMDADESVNVVHGLPMSNIISVSAIIINDDNTIHYILGKGGSALNGEMQGYISTALSTTIKLMRLTGGDFDNSVFDSTSFNRGYITIWYKV